MNHDKKTTQPALLLIAIQYITAVLIIFFFKAQLSYAWDFVKNFLFYLLVFIVPIFLFVRLKLKVSPISHLDLKFNIKAVYQGILISFAMITIFFVSNKFRTNISAFDGPFILAIVGTSLAGLFEEIIFRGFYMKFFRSKFSFIWANIITSLLFAAVHFLNIAMQGIVQLLMLFVLGLFLGYIYEKTKSLWVPILIHIVFNILIFLF